MRLVLLLPAKPDFIVFYMSTFFFAGSMAYPDSGPSGLVHNLASFLKSGATIRFENGDDPHLRLNANSRGRKIEAELSSFGLLGCLPLLERQSCFALDSPTELASQNKQISAVAEALFFCPTDSFHKPDP